LIDSALSGTKPYSRLEVARLLGTAMKKWEEIGRQKKPSGFADKDLIPSLLERFKREFKRELIEVGALEGNKPSSFLKPVDEVILKYVFQSDNPIVRTQGGNPSTHTIYLIYNKDGSCTKNRITSRRRSQEKEGSGTIFPYTTSLFLKTSRSKTLTWN